MFLRWVQFATYFCLYPSLVYQCCSMCKAVLMVNPQTLTLASVKEAFSCLEVTLGSFVASWTVSHLALGVMPFVGGVVCLTGGVQTLQMISKRSG